MLDLTPQEIETILEQAFSLKKMKDQGKPLPALLKGKNIALVFEKPSLRTKVAFEVATASLGGTAVFLPGVEIFRRADGATREKTSDIAQVLERYCDCIVARVHSHASIQDIADVASVPLINALCDGHHPTQAIADLMTIRWHKPKAKQLKVTFVGDGNNVATSLLHICAQTGLDFVHAGPPNHRIPADEWQAAEAPAQTSGSVLSFTDDPVKGITDADVVYTDTFVSMGDEAESENRLQDFAPFKVTKSLMAHAKTDAIFLHCLPAHRGEEVTDEVIDSAQSKVFDQAECRMHVAASLLAFFIH